MTPLTAANAGMAGWISVKDSLPRAGQRIVGKRAGLHGKNTWREKWDPDEPIGYMTHWRPDTDGLRQLVKEFDDALVEMGMQPNGRNKPILLPSDRSVRYLVDGREVSGLDYTDALVAGRDCWIACR